MAGFTLKNGVPINYVEAIGLCEWIEVGFQHLLHVPARAWIYAQVLRCLRAETGASVISVYPYQIGQNSDEALGSGAFWFYRKLGFRCGLPKIEQLARTEETKIAANARYRTARRTLKRLAEAHMFYEIDLVDARTVKKDECSSLFGLATTTRRAGYQLKLSSRKPACSERSLFVRNVTLICALRHSRVCRTVRNYLPTPAMLCPARREVICALTIRPRLH